MAFDIENVLKTGTRLKSGTYAIRRVLGQGGFGITYEAEQVLLGKRVAIKEFFLSGTCDRDDDGKKIFVLRSSRELFKSHKKRFLNEARRLAHLSNTHLVPVHDLFEENGTAYYVMDFVEGESLADILKRSGRPFDENTVTGILKQMLEALGSIHHQVPSLCHLDIKPANIMVDGKGKAVLIDFGASKYVATADEERSSSSSFAYTPGYAPIEQLAGIRENMGPWTDFYALGATLYNLLTGKKPNDPSVINSDRTPGKRDSIPLPSSLSERLRNLIVWLMAPDQNDRPQSEEEIMAFFNQGMTEDEVSPKVEVEQLKPSEYPVPSDDSEDIPDEDIEVMVISKSPAESKPIVEAQQNILPITVKGVSFNMVKVDGGTFIMGATPEQGDDADDDEKPAHQVILSDYFIGETEVTQELWEAVMGKNPSYFTNDSSHPVEQVSWNDCQTFIKELNILTGKTFRLPSEAEWEYAARGGSKSRHYKYSGSNNIDDVAWYGDNSGNQTHRVNTKSPNELGLYDMPGNVWEWCEDYYGPYRLPTQTNPKGLANASYRVFRGGGWNSAAERCRVSIRSGWNPDSRGRSLGLRLAL